ncbi:subtilisin-like protease-like protein [Paraphoma chrysanthemicola]|nr:subtilisin-like protease-like protein [Paraphoma chrysanthemicola]
MQFFTRFLAAAATAAPFLAQAAPVAPRAEDDFVPGKYIIQLKPDADIASIAAHHNTVREIHARNLARRNDGDESAGIEQEYDFGDFKGYAGSFDDATIDELKALPEVLFVEPDYIMYTTALTTQSSAPWGLGSISSRTRGASSYIYDTTAGAGTFSYVVDTGIRTTHTDFGGRATWGFNAVNTDNNDNNGHGTHVAGTIGGTTYGVAKRTNLIAVKVFEGRTGTTSQVIAGFQWAVRDIVSKSRTNSAVINMSLGGPGSATWDSAITAAWSQGVLSVVAAGNENVLASTRSPARSPEALTVGNLQSDDRRNPGSNYGPTVDIWAAGTGITSSWYTSNTATASLTGTSMASPHVAGLVSYLRGLEGLSSASAIRSRVLALATPGRVVDGLGAANLVAYNGNGR